MRLFTSVSAVFILLALAAVPASAGILPTFTLDPSSGAIAGDAGQVIGWGLNIGNTTPYWLIVTGVSFDGDPALGTPVGTASIGDFFDFLTPQFLSAVLAPGDTWTQAFDASASAGLGSYVAGDQGLGSYVIDGSFASLGDTVVGNITVSYELHSADPNGPLCDGCDSVTGALAPLAASVTFQPVPEPISGALVLAGLALLGLAPAVRRRS